MKRPAGIIFLAAIHFCTGGYVIYVTWPLDFGKFLFLLLGVIIFSSGVGLLYLKIWAKPISLLLVPLFSTMMLIEVLSALKIKFFPPVFFIALFAILVSFYLFYLTCTTIGKQFH